MLQEFRETGNVDVSVDFQWRLVIDDVSLLDALVGSVLIFIFVTKHYVHIFLSHCVHV